MAPSMANRPSDSSLHILAYRSNVTFGDWRLDASAEDLVVESWSEGVMLGALMIMICITISNLRAGVILHKLILTELLLAILHGTFCLMSFHGFGWYLSSTAALLYCSYVLHNFVAWIKIKPFFSAQQGSFFGPRTCIWTQRIYLSTLCMSIPPIVLQIFDNFRYFNDINQLYVKVRPYEPLMRDPWWVSTNIILLHIIRKSYGVGVLALIQHSPRLGILLTAISLALIFTTIDFCTSVIPGWALTDGINPYWKLSLVFKCLTDSIMLDDFKTELKKISSARGQMEEEQRKNIATLHKDSFASASAEVEYAGNMNARSDNMSLGRQGRRISQLPSLNMDMSLLENGASE